MLSFFFFLHLLLGCSSLPHTESLMKEVPASSSSTPTIVSSHGELPAGKSEAILNRIEQKAGPTDIIKRQQAQMELLSGQPLISGNKVLLLKDGPATYAAMFKAIEKATDTVNLETFIFQADDTGRKFADLLIKKQSEGVQVNIIYDSLGSKSTPASFFQQLRDAGIRVLEFNPVSLVGLTHRDHRKILVVDGMIAFTGGVNISSAYADKLIGISGSHDEDEPRMAWRDTHIQIEGPAVAEFQKLFLDTWKRQKGPELAERNYFPRLKPEGTDLVQVLASSPGKMNRVTFLLYVSAINNAEMYVHMTSSYFVPDDQTLSALKKAAGRGVDVEIIVPERSDSKIALYAGQYYYSQLLKSGVKLLRFNDAILHAKTAVIDDVWATVGSTNMDFWSFLRDDEVNAVILSQSFAGEMEAMFQEDVKKSSRIKPDEWKTRSVFSKIRDWFAHLLAHWL
jgi:cardiolipin synthase